MSKQELRKIAREVKQIKAELNREGLMAFEYEDVRIEVQFDVRGSSFKVFVDDEDSCLVGLDGEDFNSKQLYKAVKNAQINCRVSDIY